MARKSISPPRSLRCSHSSLLEISEAHDLNGRGSAAAQERIGACDQFAELEGFGDVIVGAEIESEDDVLLLALGREHDDGHVESVAAHDAADFVTIYLRQHDVEED